jgi:hypothetical protein
VPHEIAPGDNEKISEAKKLLMEEDLEERRGTGLKEKQCTLETKRVACRRG